MLFLALCYLSIGLIMSAITHVHGLRQAGMLGELPLIFIQKPNLVSFLGVYAFLIVFACLGISVWNYQWWVLLAVAEIYAGVFLGSILLGSAIKNLLVLSSPVLLTLILFLLL